MKFSLHSIIPRWFKKLDHYLLTHHALIWQTKAHYIIIVCILSVCLEILISSYFTNFLSVSELSNLYIYTLLLQLPFFIFYLLYLSKQVKCIKKFQSKEYLKSLFIYVLIAFILSLLYLISPLVFIQKYANSKILDENANKITKLEYYINLYRNLESIKYEIDSISIKKEYTFKYEDAWGISTEEYRTNNSFSTDNAYDYKNNNFFEKIEPSIDSVAVDSTMAYIDSTNYAVDSLATDVITSSETEKLLKFSTAELLDDFDMFKSYLTEYNVFFLKNSKYIKEKKLFDFPITNKSELNDFKLLYLKYAFLDDSYSYNTADYDYLFGKGYLDNEERIIRIKHVIPNRLKNSYFHSYLFIKDKLIKKHSDDFRSKILYNPSALFTEEIQNYDKLLLLKDEYKFFIVGVFFLFIFYLIPIIAFLILSFHTIKRLISLSILAIAVYLVVVFAITYKERGYLSHIYPKMFFYSNLVHLLLYIVVFGLLWLRLNKKKYDSFFYWLFLLTYFFNSISTLVYALNTYTTYDHQKFYFNLLIPLGFAGLLIIFFSNAIIIGKLSKLPQK